MAGLVVEGGVEVDEFDRFKPAENYPKHVVVSLGSQAESVFAKIEGSDLCEVAIDEVLVIA